METPYQATSGAHIEAQHGFEIARAAASRESIYEFPAQREVVAIKQQLCTNALSVTDDREGQKARQKRPLLMHHYYRNRDTHQ
jgi:hypothetical protein